LTDTSERRIAARRPLLLQLLQLVPDEPDRFRRTIQTAADREGPALWQDLIASASYHGVLGVLDWRILSEAHVSKDVQESTERRLAIQQIWHAHLMRGLETAVAALAGEGIEACAVKGPVLAERLYSEPAARHCLDLDLLVRPEDFDRAALVLARAGYGTGDAASTTYLRHYGHHVDFSGTGMAPIELHFRTYAGFGVELPASVLLDRAEPFRLSATLSVLAPSPEDEFLYLATHAAGHSFIRLVWLYDLKLLVRRYPSLDWDRVASCAVALGVATPVAYAARLLQSWLGVPVDGLSRSFRRPSVRSKMADWLLSEVSRPQPRSMRDNLGGLLFTSLLCDRLASSAWLVQHHVLRSTRRRLRQRVPGLFPERWSS
jgi:putative nucleotidyltransferase-like protein